MTETKAPTLFEVDCRAYLHYLDDVAYWEKYHADDPEKIQAAEHRRDRHRRDMIEFHGDRAQMWFDARNE